MKKILLLLCALLGITAGAWADVLTVTPSEGTYPTTSGNYINTITFATTPTLTVTASANNMDKRQTSSYLLWHSGSSGSSTYTISVPSGYVITEYSITGEANTSVQTLTSGSISHEFAVGTSSTFSVTGLGASSTSFVQTGANASGLKITEISVTVVELTPERQAAYDKVQSWITKIQEAEGLVTDAANYISNAKESSEGSYAALLDGVYTTYFHSAYNNAPAEDHYLQANLTDAVDAFYFYFKKRSQNQNNRPTSITIYGSNDNTNFTEITTINSGLPTTSDVIDYASSKINLGAAYQYIRFTVTATNNGASANGHVFFTYSEFYLLPSNSHVDDAMAFYLSGKKAYQYTDEEIAQVDALDLEIRSATLAPAKANVIAAYAIPDGKVGKVGYPTQTAWDTFVAAINAITVDDDFDAAKNAAIETLLASANLPNGVYKIRNYSTSHYLYQDEADGIVTYAATPVVAGNHSYWRITDNGDGTFAILDLYGHQLTKGNQGQGWSSVQGGNRTTVNAITRNYTDANYKTDGDLVSFYMDGAHINTNYNTGSKVFVTTWTTGGLGSDANHWFFEPVEGVTAYTVTITGAPENITMGDGTVLPNGTFTVFLTAADQILAPDFTNYEVSKVVEGTTATITYTVTDYAGLITAYLTEDKMNNIGGAGKLGYMQNTGEDFTNLMNLLLTFQDPAHVYTAADYNNLITYYEAAAANIKLPEGGKFYLIKNVSNGKYLRALGMTRGNIYADVDAENITAASIVKATERGGRLFLGTQGAEFSWVYGKSTGYAAFMETEGKKAVFTVTTPGQIAFAHGLGNLEGDYSDYVNVSYYEVNSDGLVWGSSSPTDAEAQWIFEEVTSITLALNAVGDKSYATTYLPFGVTLGGDVKAYALTVSGEWAIPAEYGSAVPAGTPVLLVSESGATSVTATIDDTITPIDLANALQGSYFASTPTAYVLNAVADVPGFYALNGTLAANRAYLPKSTEVKGYAFNWGDADAIKAIEANKAAGKTIYNLAGQRVENAQKGIFIVNGKKVVIK